MTSHPPDQPDSVADAAGQRVKRSESGEPRIAGRVSPPMLKTLGYCISTVSVALLAIVAWPRAKGDPLLLACLIGGALASIIGMSCRWLSYELEKRRKDQND